MISVFSIELSSTCFILVNIQQGPQHTAWQLFLTLFITFHVQNETSRAEQEKNIAFKYMKCLSIPHQSTTSTNALYKYQLVDTTGVCSKPFRIMHICTDTLQEA